MKSATLALLLLALLSSAFAQPPDTVWTKIYSPITIYCQSYPSSIQLTTDGGLIVSLTDVFEFHWTYFYSGVFKTNAMGEQLWRYSFDSAPLGTYSYAFDACETAGGNYVVAGRPRSTVLPMPTIIQISDSGVIHWQQSWGYYCRSIHRLTDGGFVACADSDYSICRTDSAGNPIWHRGFPATMRKVAIVPDGGYAVFGETTMIGAGGKDFILARLTENGDTLWTRTYGTTGDERAWSFCVTRDDGFIMAGSQIDPDSTYPHSYILKTDRNGIPVWQHTHSLGYLDEFTDVIAASNHAYVATAYAQNIENGNFVYRALIREFDVTGDTLWTMTLPQSDLIARAIVQTADSGYAVLCGYQEGLTYIAKLARDPLSAQNKPTPLARNFALSAFPNPFNPSTTISFTLPREARARIAVFDILGREVAVLTDQVFTSGEHRVLFNGSSLSAGLYFARLQSGNLMQTTKLLLLK